MKRMIRLEKLQVLILCITLLFSFNTTISADPIIDADKHIKINDMSKLTKSDSFVAWDVKWYKVADCNLRLSDYATDGENLIAYSDGYGGSIPANLFEFRDGNITNINKYITGNERYADKKFLLYDDEKFVLINDVIYSEENKALAYYSKDKIKEIYFDIPYNAVYSTDEELNYIPDTGDYKRALVVKSIHYYDGVYYLFTNRGYSNKKDTIEYNSVRFIITHPFFGSSTVLYSKDLMNWKLLDVDDNLYFGPDTMIEGDNIYMTNQENIMFKYEENELKIINEYPTLVDMENANSNNILDDLGHEKMTNIQSRFRNVIYDGEKYIAYYNYITPSKMISDNQMNYLGGKQIFTSIDGSKWTPAFGELFSKESQDNLHYTIDSFCNVSDNCFIVGKKSVLWDENDRSKGSVLEHKKPIIYYSSDGYNWSKERVYCSDITFGIVSTDQCFYMVAEGKLFKGIPLFNDLPKYHWANDYILDLVNEQIISGYKGNIFKPNKEVTNAEYIKMIMSVLCDDIEVQVKEHWATNYFEKAVELGILKDKEYVLQDYNEKMRREDMAHVLANALRYIGIKDSEDIEIYMRKLKDSDDISTTKINDVVLVVKEGIIIGNENNNFLPDNNVTRAAAAKTIKMLMERIEE